MLDSTHDVFQFPCPFAVKAFGRNSDEFEALVVAIVRRHAPDLEDAAVSSRLSGGGAYRSVTANIIANSREQLDAIYMDLNDHDQVLMVL